MNLLHGKMMGCFEPPELMKRKRKLLFNYFILIIKASIYHSLNQRLEEILTNISLPFLDFDVCKKTKIENKFWFAFRLFQVES